MSALDLPSSRRPTPPRLLVYGAHGVGKTTLACATPSPVLIDLEDGAREIDAPTFGVLRSIEEVEAAIKRLMTEEHQFETVVLDTADALEWLVWQHTCKRKGWASIETPGFGKGFVEALETWRYVLDGLDLLRDGRGMAVVMTAHAEVKRFDSPETEPYERYQPKLQARASALLQERVDAVLFAGYRVSVAKSDVGFNKKVVRGVGGGERLLWTTERPAALAKNRYGMPDTLPLDWQPIAATIPYYSENKEPVK